MCHEHGKQTVFLPWHIRYNCQFPALPPPPNQDQQMGQAGQKGPPGQEAAKMVVLRSGSDQFSLTSIFPHREA